MRGRPAFVRQVFLYSNRLLKKFIPAGIVKRLAARIARYRRIRILPDRALRNSEMYRRHR